MTQRSELDAAYARCRRMQRRHDPTFFVATARLPREVRPAVHALYGFLRGADEIVDGPHRAPDPDVRRAALDAWLGALQDGVARGRSDHPVLAALVDAGPRHGLPLHLLPAYVESMRIDCGPVEMRDDAELDRYMNGSAATVGRVLAPLLGVPAGDAETVARLGLAFQLTNFVRDAREDLALGRVYLPGLREDPREAAAAQVARARALFASAAEPPVDGRMRCGIRVARAVYEAVLDRVEALDFDVLARRPAPRPWQLVPAAARSLSR